MSDKAKKWILWGSIIILLLSAGGLIYISSLPYTDTVDFIQVCFILIIILSILNLVFLLANKYQNRNGFRKTVRIISWFLPLIIVLLFIFEASWFPLVPDLLIFACLSLILILLVIANMHIFMINDTKAIMGIVLILLYIIVTLVLERINYADMEKHLVSL
jgi:hypothetical protein